MEFFEVHEIILEIMIGKILEVVYPFEVKALVYDISFNSRHPDPGRYLRKIWKSLRKFECQDISSCYIVSVYVDGSFYSSTLSWKMFSNEKKCLEDICEVIKDAINELKLRKNKIT